MTSAGLQHSLGSMPGPPLPQSQMAQAMQVRPEVVQAMAYRLTPEELRKRCDNLQIALRRVEENEYGADVQAQKSQEVLQRLEEDLARHRRALRRRVLSDRQRDRQLELDLQEAEARVQQLRQQREAAVAGPARSAAAAALCAGGQNVPAGMQQAPQLQQAPAAVPGHQIALQARPDPLDPRMGQVQPVPKALILINQAEVHVCAWLQCMRSACLQCVSCSRDPMSLSAQPQRRIRPGRLLESCSPSIARPAAAGAPLWGGGGGQWCCVLFFVCVCVCVFVWVCVQV